MADATIKMLIHKRGVIKSQLTKFKTFLDQYPENRDEGSLLTRVTKIEATWDAFNEIQNELEINDGLENHQAERDTYEELYFDLIGKARNFQTRNALSPTTVATNPQPSGSTFGIGSVNQSTVQLPKMQLPKFNGSYDAWLGFQDAFLSLIHSNETLPAVQKLHYLRSCLSGEPEQIIQTLESTSENYEVAWSLLRDSYDNRRIIIQKHISCLFELPTVTRDSASSIRNLIHTVQQHVRALKALKQPVQHWDAMLIYSITNKLDRNTRREWDRSLKNDSDPTLEEMISFLRNHSQYAESYTPTTSKTITPIFPNKGQEYAINTRNNPQYKKTQSKNFVVTRYTTNCPICKQNHYIQTCQTFLKQSTSERLESAKKAGLCTNCLRTNHTVSNCQSSNCLRCHERHHTLLHSDNATSSTLYAKSGEATTSKNTTSLVTLLSTFSSEALLPTAIINIADQSGKLHPCRVLLDSCSQSNFITENIVTTLKLEKKPFKTSINWLNHMNTPIKYIVNATVNSRNSNFAANITFLTIPQITDHLPNEPINLESLKIPDNLRLADPNFNIPSDIDGIIGVEMFFTLLNKGKINLSTQPNHAAFLQKTQLGWIFAGRLTTNSNQPKKIRCHFHIDLSTQLSKFWEAEEISDTRHFSAEEQACETHFQKTFERDSTGRYLVRLPFSDLKSQLGDSHMAANKRFQALERKLNAHSDLKGEYHNFMTEYTQLGHMSEIKSEEQKPNYYLPHHAVFKHSSNTTKVRVVFDGSAKTSSGISLNDALLTGPTIQDDLFSIILRFRIHTYVLTADIEKMYRQVLVHTDDRQYQQILWRHSEHEPLKTYQLNTVTYGLTSAPFLAIRTLHQLAEDEGNRFPRAAEILERDFYVDDILTGSSTYEEASLLISELTDLLKLGGFNLRQWFSNEASLLRGLPEHNVNMQPLLDTNQTVKALGVHWNSSKDTIVYTIDLPIHSKKTTKRSILSQTAQLFDPLGLLGPVILYAKILMQQLWLSKLDWDEPVPMNTYSLWKQYKTELQLLNNITFKRKLTVDNPCNIQLHGFCDASEKAYGACIYIRSINKNNECVTTLVCAKSKVAPLKIVSLPRLELCAAVLLSKLYKQVSKALDIPFDKTLFWSDSTITLHWINKSPHTLKTYVANRVAEIQSTSNSENWRHISSGDNPADSLSRGQTPSEFLNNSLWNSGPTWLRLNECMWPNK